MNIFHIFVSASPFLTSVLSNFNNTNEFKDTDKKSRWQPPSFVFGIVWPILYALLFYLTFTILSSKTNNCLKNSLIRTTLLESALQGLWLYNFNSNRGKNKYDSSLLVMSTLVVLSFLRLVFFYTYFNDLYYFYIPYFLWINFAHILNWQLFLNIVK